MVLPPECKFSHIEGLRPLLLDMVFLIFFFNFTAQETESGHGIMEEPELTLVSTSDISITEMDFANLSIEEKDEAKSYQVNVKYT